ncbi:hypothetical protein HG535_0E02040 [Zygotorulaspora mrakii]|uniref:Uncharacterized protein n=1 Tax=Zygotorulaspora mrakii TaxID=42260 RepID=A0A7H9B3C7_ZYGMR|nr:uncharacterized protein HG535_0E02040 [Zygotorulaspora mrakii]QLG73120.1 hypothetical protein HG535_0E02040 [Zygotorulaspora mrakii]
MSVDWVIQWVFLPVVKCPFLLCFLCRIKSRLVWCFCVLYSVSLFILLKVNTRFKCHGANLWVTIEHIKNARVVITGGSSGLGHAIIKELLSRYKDLTIFNIDLNESPIADKRIKTYKCDLGISSERDEMIKKIQRDCDGPVHLVVNNAGMRSKYQQFQKLHGKAFEHILSVNTLAPTKIIQAFAPKENNLDQCYIVNVASTLAILSASKVAPYASSKAALIALHRSYCFELESRHISNIRTLLVVPGQLNTDLFGGFTPPRQFFAPVVDCDALAKSIVDRCEKGQRGDLCAPFYSNLISLLMSLPYAVQILARKFAQLDDCLPDD